MKFWEIFRPLKSWKQSRWRELGTYNAVFAPFGQNIWLSSDVRACVRALSDHTKKAHATSNNPEIAKMLNESPNMYMTGSDFLAKVRNWLEIKNTAFIYIGRNDRGQMNSVYNVPYESFEAIDYEGSLFIKFTFANPAVRQFVFPWEDLAVLRKDFFTSDIWGDSNDIILPTLETIAITKQGEANAVKATANLRGILKSTKAMLAGDDVKKSKDEFVRDYINLENTSGIASLDATMDFTPIKMEPTTISADVKKQNHEDVLEYFGVNDKILMSSYDEDTYEAFYQSKIEPFLVALSQELTRKAFTQRERALGAHIVYEGEHLKYASFKTKLQFVSLVDRGMMTPNEFRAFFNLKPFEGGDQFIRRLDTAVTGEKGGEVNE